MGSEVLVQLAEGVGSFGEQLVFSPVSLGIDWTGDDQF